MTRTFGSISSKWHNLSLGRQYYAIAFLYAILAHMFAMSQLVAATGLTSTKFHPTKAGVPSSYENCVADPTNNSLTSINLLSLNDGFAVNNHNGLAGLKTSNTNKSLTYHLDGSHSPFSWAYDLVSDHQGTNTILAVFRNSSVGFVQKSSRGQNYTIDKDGNSYVTTIFALTCGGEIIAGFADGHQLTFLERHGLVYAEKKASRSSEKETGQSSEKRGVAGKALRLFIYLKLGILFPYDDPRCSESDQEPVEKKNARPVGENGCGSTSFKVPDLWFLDCCNNHDHCYDDCSADFTTCNENFRSCNLNSCQSTFPNRSQILERYGCRNLANMYANAVSSPLGESVWESDDRCECKCKNEAETKCSGKCVNLQTDAQNCGSCGNVCPYGTGCSNGSCTSSSSRCPNRSNLPYSCVGSCGEAARGCNAGQNFCGDYGNCVCRTTTAGDAACVYTNFDFGCRYGGGSGSSNETGCLSDDDCDCKSRCIPSDNCCGIGICAYGGYCSQQTAQSCFNH